MKEEVLRMEHVTTDGYEMTNLDNMSMHIFKGEIAGLLPVDGQGRKKLLEVLEYNTALRYGRVYLENRLVNTYAKSSRSTNRVYVISGRNRLIQDLSVCDNLFVVRKGFRQYIVNKKLLYREARRVMELAQLQLDPSTLADELTEYERVAIELLKAVVQRSALIVLDEVAALLGQQELLKLRALMHRYAQQGFSFLYIGNHHEEVLPMCGRTMVMKGGRIVKIVNGQDITDEAILKIAGSARFMEIYLQKNTKSARPEAPKQSGEAAIEFRDVSTEYLDHLSFSVQPGECVGLMDRGTSLDEELLRPITGRGSRWTGEILCGGKVLQAGSRHFLDESIAVIEAYAHKSMIFPELSFMDNLCILTDRKLKGFWMQSRARQSIRKEYAGVFGSDFDETDMRKVSKKSKYTLVYYRYCMLRPKVVFCVQPFVGVDVQLREHILDLIHALKERGIAVVILTTGQTDSFFEADRFLVLEHGRLTQEFGKDEFKKLWGNLYQNG